MTTSIAFTGGNWKGSPLHDWFAGLESRYGTCCSYADGVTITDAQWDMKDGHYRVFIYNQWIRVPDDAVVVEKNIYGQPVVWPYTSWIKKRRRAGPSHDQSQMFPPRGSSMKLTTGYVRSILDYDPYGAICVPTLSSRSVLDRE